MIKEEARITMRKIKRIVVNTGIGMIETETETEIETSRKAEMVVRITKRTVIETKVVIMIAGTGVETGI
jgi:hypothetical protein